MDEAGFTLIETVIALLVFAVIVPVAFGAIRSLVSQDNNVDGLIASLQQDQLAGRSLFSSLQSADSFSSTSSASSLTAELEEGYSATGGGAETATFTASCVTSTPGVGKLTVAISPFGGTDPREDTYYVAAPASGPCSLFSYGTPQDGDPVEPVWSPEPAPTTVAVKIDVTFLAGPTTAPAGSSVRASTLQTVVYLQDAASTPAPATTTTLSSSARPVTGSPLTLTARVNPTPDGGAVAFSVSSPGGGSASCQASPLSSGVATCSFTPGVPGTYQVSAQYSGDTNFVASQSSSINLLVGAA